MAGVNRLDRFGDFVIIDSLVKTYKGVYSHDDIFNMEIPLVHNLILLNKELSYIESNTNDIQRKLKK